MPSSKAVVSVFDHGFLYGDGVYETVRAYDRHLFRWRDHAQRFRRSARAVGLSFPWTDDWLLKAVQRVLAGNRLTTATLRLCLSRGPGALGLDPAHCDQPTLAILPHPSISYDTCRETGVTALVASRQRMASACLEARIKSASALPLVLAKAEARRQGACEGLLLNASGHLTEGTVSNIFFVRRGALHTPALACGVLEGITRRVVLALARRANLRVAEERYAASVLLSADEIFLTNCTWELLPVVRWKFAGKTHPVSDGKVGRITRLLQQLYRGEVVREARKPLAIISNVSNKTKRGYVRK